MGQLVRTELHQPARSERYSRKTEHRGIPAARRNVEDIDQSAVHLIGDDDRGDELLGAVRARLPQRQGMPQCYHSDERQTGRRTCR